ncbi:MAG: glycoside hydrolase family 2 TIM barrel-domain containing protein [bacterium]
MSKRIGISALALTLYLLAAFALSFAPELSLWHGLIIFMPVACLMISLAWTVPHPDFREAGPAAHAPIEDLSNPTRKVLWLNGPWEFKLAGERRTHRLDVPRPWNTVRGLEYYTGAAVYRRLVKLPENWSQGALFLRCRGANYRAVVSIDGRQAGSHEGGFSPFEFEVTDRISLDREHEIEIVVDNTLSATTVPNVVCWNNDGGILREIYLETRNQIHIDDVYLLSSPDLKGRADIALIIKIRNPALEPRDFKIEIFSPQGALIHENKIEGWTMQSLQHRLQINFASLWSPENPALYRCRVSVCEDGGDERSFVFGIREFECGPDGFLLNGKPLRLRGVTHIEESPELGRTQTLAQMKQDLEAAKAAGFNLIRFGCFPTHQKTLELCDKMGLLALEEIPVWNATVLDFSDPGYQQAAEAQLREVVLRDRNHPSLLAWGLANSIESDTAEARWFVERLAGIARGFDDRSVYIATSDPEHEMCADLVDFIAVDIESKSFDTISRRVEAAAKLGPPAVLFHHGDQAYRPAGSRSAGAPGTEEHQALFIRDFIAAFDEHPQLAGWAVSSLADYRDPSNFAGPTPFARRHGLLTSAREEKLAYAAASKSLRGEKTSEIAVRERRLPITSFAKILAAAWAIAAVFYFFLDPRQTINLAYNPRAFIEGDPLSWRVILFISIFTALNLAILIYRFFRAAPRKMLGSIDMPFLRIISVLLSAEWTLFLWSYFTIVWFWVFDATLLHFFLPSKDISYIFAVTAALSLPEVLFVFASFFRVSLIAVLLAFNIWKLYLCFSVLGLMGTIAYVVIGPAAVFIICVAVAEIKFHILKYVRNML